MIVLYMLGGIGMPIPPSKFKPKRPKKEVDSVKIWGEAIDALLEGRKIQVICHDNGHKQIFLSYRMVRHLLGTKGKKLPVMSKKVGARLAEKYSQAGWMDVFFGDGSSNFHMSFPPEEK